MDVPISAFEVYHRQKKKRKEVPKHREPKAIPAMKKKKKNNKGKTLINKKILIDAGREVTGALKKEKKKPVDKKSKVNSGHNGNGLVVSSDDEIPILVPITDSSNIVKKDSKITNILAQVESNKTSPTHETIQNKAKKNAKSSKPILEAVNNTPSSCNESQPFNPVTQSLAIFKWLIDPISPKEFFESYWEKKVLFVKRSDREYFDGVFSSEKLDNILREYPLHFTRNIDVVAYEDGKKVVVEEEGRALPSKLWDFYSNGCSVRILNPQTYDRNVHFIISSLQEYFGTMVGTNAYLTPAGSQGFAPHFDDIEAFIVQLEGTKYWKLYKPKEEDVLARDSSPNFKSEDLGDPFMEVTLNAGDVLYFPRGTIHEGHTKDDQHSLHITVSMYQHTAYIDLLEQAIPAALKKAASQDVEFRKGLPLNYLKHLGVVNKNDQSTKRQMIINKVKSLVDTLVNYLDVDAAADSLGRKFMHDAMPPLYLTQEARHSCKYDGDCMRNGKVFNRVEISPDIRIRLLRYYALRVVQESDATSKIYFCADNATTYHGEEEQWLEIDNSMIPGIEMLQKKYPEFIDADSLPLEDKIDKLSLISSLWEHGLLVTDEPLPSYDSDVDGSSNSSSVVYQNSDD